MPLGRCGTRVLLRPAAAPFPEPNGGAADQVEEQQVSDQGGEQFGQAGESQEAFALGGEGRAGHEVEDPDRHAEQQAEDQPACFAEIEQVPLRWNGPQQQASRQYQEPESRRSSFSVFWR